jgi:hypothetical protein
MRPDHDVDGADSTKTDDAQEAGGFRGRKGRVLLERLHAAKS